MPHYESVTSQCGSCRGQGTVVLGVPPDAKTVTCGGCNGSGTVTTQILVED